MLTHRRDTTPIQFVSCLIPELCLSFLLSDLPTIFADEITSIGTPDYNSPPRLCQGYQATFTFLSKSLRFGPVPTYRVGLPATELT
jgi:hypothetical protein